MAQFAIHVKNQNDNNVPRGRITYQCITEKEKCCPNYVPGQSFVFSDGVCFLDISSVDHRHIMVIQAAGYNNETVNIPTFPAQLGKRVPVKMIASLISGNIPATLRIAWNAYLQAVRLLEEAKEQDREHLKRLLEEARKRLLYRLRDLGIPNPEEYLYDVEYEVDRITTAREIIYKKRDLPSTVMSS